MKRFPEVLAPGIGAMLPEHDDPSLAERERDLLDLPRPLGDHRHILQVKLPFEVAGYERLTVEREGDRVRGCA